MDVPGICHNWRQYWSGSGFEEINVTGTFRSHSSRSHFCLVVILVMPGGHFLWGMKKVRDFARFAIEGSPKASAPCRLLHDRSQKPQTKLGKAPARTI